MSTIAERIIELCEIKTEGNMSEFARSIDVSPAYISKLKNDPSRVPADRTLRDICDKYNVNPKWLREGSGDRFLPSRESEAELLDRFMEELDNPMRDTIMAVVKTYMELDDKDKEVLKNYAKSLSEKIR